jgi:hypothetical protein
MLPRLQFAQHHLDLKSTPIPDEPHRHLVSGLILEEGVDVGMVGIQGDITDLGDDITCLQSSLFSRAATAAGILETDILDLVY